MSEINKNALKPFNRPETEKTYNKGSDTMMLGTEIETWLVQLQDNAKQPVTMMSAAQSQEILTLLASNNDSVVFSEKNGTRFPGIQPDMPLVFVESNNVSYQLELCGVLETATAPYLLSNINDLAEKINESQQGIAQIAMNSGLVAYDGAVLGSATIADCEMNMVQRERLQSEWEKFKLDGDKAPGLRTMGMAASTQVSISYRNEQELKEMFQLGNLLSPLLISAFANTTGFEEGNKTNRLSRAQWWLDHNQYAPRGGVPDFALDLMFGMSQKNVAAQWMDYVASTPMVYFINAQNQPDFSSSPSFNQLDKQGLGTEANYFLAESLTWPDVKLIGGKRIEMRMCDNGSWQPLALTALCATLMANETGRKQALDKLYGTGITRDEFVQARNDVPNQGLDTNFGNTNLRKLLPEIIELALGNAESIGLKPEYLESLKCLQENPVSDFEMRRDQFDCAFEADMAVLKDEYDQRLPLATCRV